MARHRAGEGTPLVAEQLGALEVRFQLSDGVGREWPTAPARPVDQLSERRFPGAGGSYKDERGAGAGIELYTPEHVQHGGRVGDEAIHEAGALGRRRHGPPPLPRGVRPQPDDGKGARRDEAGIGRCKSRARGVKVRLVHLFVATAQRWFPRETFSTRTALRGHNGSLGSPLGERLWTAPRQSLSDAVVHPRLPTVVQMLLRRSN